MGAGKVELSIRELAEMTGEETYKLRIYAASHKYIFLTPTRKGKYGIEPRIKRRIGYVAVYTKDRKHAVVFTNSRYLKERDYAVEVVLHEQ